MTAPGNAYPEVNEMTQVEEHVARLEQSLEMERMKNSHMEEELVGVKKQLSEKIMENQILGALDMEELNRANVESLKKLKIEAAISRRTTDVFKTALATTREESASKLMNLNAELESEKSKCSKLEEELAQVKKQLEDAATEENLVESYKRNEAELDTLLTELLVKTELEAKAREEKEEMQDKMSRLEQALGVALNEKAENEEIWRRKEVQMTGVTNRNALLEDYLKSLKKRLVEETQDYQEKLDQQQTTILTLARLLAKCAFKESDSSERLLSPSIATDACSISTNDGSTEGYSLSTYATLEATDRVGPSMSTSSPVEYLNTICMLCSCEFQPDQETMKCAHCGIQAHKECASKNKKKGRTVCFGCGKGIKVAEGEAET